jgi:hypothetical protein
MAIIAPIIAIQELAILFFFPNLSASIPHPIVDINPHMLYINPFNTPYSDKNIG